MKMECFLIFYVRILYVQFQVLHQCGIYFCLLCHYEFMLFSCRIDGAFYIKRLDNIDSKKVKLLSTAKNIKPAQGFIEQTALVTLLGFGKIQEVMFYKFFTTFFTINRCHKLKCYVKL